MKKIKYIETFEFISNGESLPGINKWLRFLFQIQKLPFGFMITKELIRKALRLPKNISFLPGFSVKAGKIYCDENVSLGNTQFIDYAPIYIGKNTSFSFNNVVITSTHDFENFNRVIAKSIIIEDNVWITSNVLILMGVRIGENSVIGAGSVVTKDIPDNVFAAGNPCKPLKTINRTTRHD